MAQTQQGYVKTKGRLGSNGTVIAGTRLQGATVSVKGGNSVVSGNNGTFSLSVPTNSYYLQNVQKQGYVLTDPDVLSKQYAYSKNPLVLVLETPSQQTDDKLAAEKKIRRMLLHQLQEKEDELESLKEQQKLSENEYRERLQDVYAQQENNEKLISEMADRYSKMDFDEVDEFNRKISSLILEGKLTEADSLLNAKGDINTRAATLRQHQEANVQAEQKLKQKQSELEKSKAMTQKELEELAQDCYSKFTIFKMQHQNDSAAYYVELRSEQDTLNVSWQNESGLFVQNYLSNFSKALFYFERALRQSIGQYGEFSIITASICNNIGSVYSDQGMCAKAMDYFNRSLEIRKSIHGLDAPDVAQCLINIGYVYSTQKNYSTALDFYKKALCIYEKNSGEYQEKIAICCNNIGFVLTNLGNYNESQNYNEKAFFIYKSLYGDDHPRTALLYNNLGKLYALLGDKARALQYYEQALAIWRRNFNGKHKWIANVCSNIGGIYYKDGDYARALSYYEESFNINRSLLGKENPKVKSSEANLMVIQLAQATKEGKRDDYLSQILFTAIVIDGNTPARQKGMNGEYILLEYNNYYVEDPDSLNQKSTNSRGKPKVILVMKNDEIKEYYFENSIGILFGMKQVSREEKQRINIEYEMWKKRNRG